MLRRDRQLRTQIYQLKDAALFAVALWLAHLIRFYAPAKVLWLSFDPIDTFEQFAWLYLIIIPGVPLVLEAQGFYQRPLFASRRETAWILFKSCAMATVGVILVMWLFRMTGLARGVIVLFGFISFALVMANEELLRLGYKSRFGQLQMKKRILLVGAKADTLRMREELRSQRHDDMDVVGELDINEATIDDLVRLLHESSANGVILNAKHTYFGQVEKAIHACELEGVEAWLIADFFKTHISQTTFDDFYGRPVMVFRSTPEASWQGVFKQLLDLIVAFVLLIFLTPLFIGVALGIRISSPGPVLFKQRRCGLNGRPFTMLKFRSMVSDAEQRKQELAALNEMGGPVFKVSNDPRITRIGRWLRKHSVDELPQLFNVLRGEMSLVGPRPLPVDEVQRFDDPSHRRRLSVKPGLTCLWQVSGRNNLKDFRDWVRLDLEYIDNWSFWLDLKILWRTIPVVLTGAGAK
ncbi:MAG TPA: sugar transferase [Candidatus Saccharimonadales bacterium]|nr:sugar transferase [Candidatus Saccharimonadales bacterium]